MAKEFSEMSTDELLRQYREGGQDELVRRMRAREASGAVPKSFQGGFSALTELECPIWQAHRDRLKAWVTGFSKATVKGLYLSGPLGCGKSRLAWVAVEELKHKGYFIEAWNVSKMFDAIMNSFVNSLAEPSSGEITENAMEADLLMLDDLGAEPKEGDGSTKEWIMQKLYTIGNHRLEEEKPILVTSNLNGQELSDRMSDVTGRRFIDRLCGMIELPGMAFIPVEAICRGCEFFEKKKTADGKTILKCNRKSLRRI